MNSREMDTEVRRLAAERGWGDWPEDQRTLTAFYLINDREEARWRLGRHIEAVRQDLDRLEKILKAPSPSLNTLGELQQRPAAVEAVVGEFAAADRAFRRYLETYPVKGQ